MIGRIASLMGFGAGTLKLAAIAALAVGLAYAGGRLQGYLSGLDVGYAKKTAEIKGNTDDVNEANDRLRVKVRELIQTEAALRDLLERRSQSGVSYIVTQAEIEARK